jgi:hypothetical protein
MRFFLFEIMKDVQLKCYQIIRYYANKICKFGDHLPTPLGFVEEFELAGKGK